MTVEIKGLGGFLEEAAELEKECFTDPWSKEEMETALRNPAFHCLGETFDGVLASYVITSTVSDECEILNIAVKPEYRRRGIGESLLSKALCRAEEKGAKTVWLEVRESNTPAIALYEKFGFSKVGTRKNYYRKPVEHAVIMMSRLPLCHGDNDADPCD